MRQLLIILLSALLGPSGCFVASGSPVLTTSLLVLRAKDAENENVSRPFFARVKSMITNLDDIVDDFVGKRMGNGEQFYGKRKYKPSGRIDGEYNGMGLSDRLKIDVTREYKNERLEEQRRRRQEEESS